jgi:hypothetical protein
MQEIPHKKGITRPLSRSSKLLRGPTAV